MPFPWLAAAVAANAIPGIAKMFGGGEDEESGDIQTISTLNPEQQALFSKYAPWLQSKVGQGLPAYTGEMVAPTSSFETAGLSKLGEYLQGTPDIANFGLTQYKNALAGMNPTETANWYNEYVMPEQKRMQEEVVIPGVREAYAGPLSAYYSEPRMGAEARSWNQFGTTQQGALGNAIMSERQSARSLLPYLTEMSKLEGGMPQIEAAMTYGAVPRAIQQANLTAKFEEFKRTTPELSPVIDMIQNLLNTQTMAAFGPGGQTIAPSPFASLLSALGPAIGSYLGSKGSTATTPNYNEAANYIAS
jgi:hypothetical protein